MGTTASATGAAHGRRRMAAAALLGIAVLSLLYVVFLFQVYNDPGIRDLGFTGQAEIWRYSALVFAFLFALMLAVWMRWVPSGGHEGAPAAAGGAVVAPRPGGAAPARAQAGASDPASRPGAPPSTRVPLIPPEVLQGGWKRYKFPAERTGGLYVDTDIVVDDAPPELSESTARGRLILRVRDEVARVCVRCELIDHCHSKVAALITLEDMRGNHECVPGLKRIAQARIEGMKRAQLERQAAAAVSEPGSAPEAASGSPSDTGPAAAPPPAPGSPEERAPAADSPPADEGNPAPDSN